MAILGLASLAALLVDRHGEGALIRVGFAGRDAVSRWAIPEGDFDPGSGWPPQVDPQGSRPSNTQS